VAVCNDSVESDLVKVRGLELQHLVDTVAADLVRGVANLLGGVVGATEAGGDQLLGVLVQEVEGLQVCTGGDLDKLCESVSDLCLGKRAEEGEVKEGLDGCVVSTETVLVVAVVNGNLDGDGGINETNDGGGDTDVVGVSAVCGASETKQSRRLVFKS